MRVRGPIHWPIQIYDSDVQHFDLYYIEIDEDRYIVGITGDIDQQPIPLRIESACVYGHIFRGIKCDCGDQFEEALLKMMEKEHGIVIFAYDDDARGHGVEMHFKLYELRQHEGRMDEREIFDEMGLDIDIRNYEPVLEILNYFSIDSVEIMTNNPERIKVLKDSEVTIADRIPLETEINEHNEKLLLQEKEWLGYETSYKTHDEWVETFEQEMDGVSGQYGYMITHDHTKLANVESGQRLPDEENVLDQLSGDQFITLYVNFDPIETLVRKADKVIRIEADGWNEFSELQKKEITH